MIRVAITEPITLPIPTHSGFMNRMAELTPILGEYGIQLIDDPRRADFEIRNGVGLTQGHPAILPRSRVIVMDGEPPQPEFLLPYYRGEGYADVLCPANLRAYAPDGMAYFNRPTEPLPPLRFRQKMIQLSTFRTTSAQVVSGTVNGSDAYSWPLLCTQRCQLGLAIKRNWPDLIDICGRGWPEGTTIEDSRQGKWGDRKRDLLNSYAFNLCWENMEIPYYVTEKLWDPILSGSLPVYWGPPEMHDRIPMNTIIDCRTYANGTNFDLEGLVDDLMMMSEAEWTRRMESLRDWLMSFPLETRPRSLEFVARELALSIVAAAERVTSTADETSVPTA